MARIKGTNFADDIHGTDGDDVIFGLAGNDIIRASDGDDVINGGKGWDLMDYTTYHGRLSIKLQDKGETQVYGDGVHRDTLVSIEQIIGGSGDDYFVGNKSNNVFGGGAGHDYFVASNGYDTYRGDAGYDLVDFSHIGGGVTFKIDGKSGATYVYGRDGSYDVLVSIENVIGTKYDDVIRGGAEDNYFRGLGGNDILIGGGSGDVLDGGAGNDRLTGGKDADVFDFNGKFGHDVITDFNAAGDHHDVIDLQDVGYFPCFDDLITYSAEQVGKDVVIDGGKYGEITLKNVDIHDLSSDDFLF
ncbi:calcium-binding protein [Rhizobium sp. TRM95796]|uniref:calcium-binding protein n=1 Tax=Rhizobium sp. TRM95796 TaxID=2979862 RepID=UPI0021E7E121|nr:calcium-binding protein [Rhizobium sp. TRM95796]MCV3764308.1 M10 family metallopeptidase C-terminal domain-containing protein [Rhizobium sp. TRM95796]